MARLVFLVTISLHVCLVLALLVFEGLLVAPRNYLDSLERGEIADVQQLRGSLAAIELARGIRPLAADPDLMAARLQLWLGKTVAESESLQTALVRLQDAQAKRPSWGAPVSDQARLLIKQGQWGKGGREALEVSLKLGPHEYFLLRRYLTLGALYYRSESTSFRQQFVQHLRYALGVRYQNDLVQLLVIHRLEEALSAALLELEDSHPLKTVYQEQLRWMLSVRDAPSA